MQNATALSPASLGAALWQDDAGFVVSAELVLVGTVVVLAMIVGLSEVAHGVNQELEDLGSSFGSLNQSYMVSGQTGPKGMKAGSLFEDGRDECDAEFDIVCDGGAIAEGDYFYGGHGY